MREHWDRPREGRVSFHSGTSGFSIYRSMGICAVLSCQPACTYIPVAPIEPLSLSEGKGGKIFDTGSCSSFHEKLNLCRICDIFF